MDGIVIQIKRSLCHQEETKMVFQWFRATKTIRHHLANFWKQPIQPSVIDSPLKSWWESCRYFWHSFLAKKITVTSTGNWGTRKLCLKFLLCTLRYLRFHALKLPTLNFLTVSHAKGSPTPCTCVLSPSCVQEN